MTAAWVRCRKCENFLCNIHGGHVHDCGCPSLEWWDGVVGIDPYAEGGSLTPAQIESRIAETGWVEP